MYKKSDSSSGKPFANSNSQGFKRKKAGPGKPFSKSGGERKADQPFNRERNNDDRGQSFGGENASGEKRSFRSSDNKKPYQRDNKNSFGAGSEGKSFESRPFKRDGDRPFKKDGDRPFKRDGDKPFRKDGDRPFKREGDKPFSKDGDRPFKRDGDKPFSKDGDRPFKRDGDKPFRKDGDRPFKRDGDKPFSKDGDRPFKRDGDKPKFGSDRPKRFEKSEGGPSDGKRTFDKKGAYPKKTEGDRPEKKRIGKSDEKRPFKKGPGDRPDLEDRKKNRPEHDKELSMFSKKIMHEDDDDDFDEAAYNAGIPKVRSKAPKQETEDNMPLNKFMAHSGVCSRRDAANLVKEGKVKVNDELVLDPGRKILPDDVVTMGDKKLTIQKGMVYILLNKPKDYITTNDDPQGRRTVMDLVEGADADRLFPVGRLDRNTSGLLLITNDGDLTQKLAHPSYKIKKIYHVTLDKPLTKADSEKIMNGLELEDGITQVDALAFLEAKNELGIEIHSGKNRIVRRIFESLGYVVEKLDRMMYAGLTKKNLPRGKWRYLNEREIVLLKHFKS